MALSSLQAGDQSGERCLGHIERSEVLVGSATKSNTRASLPSTISLLVVRFTATITERQTIVTRRIVHLE